jgi:hypothetical protein
VRLKKRERALERHFEDSTFMALVLAPELLTRRSALREAPARWSAVDLAGHERCGRRLNLAAGLSRKSGARLPLWSDRLMRRIGMRE